MIQKASKSSYVKWKEKVVTRHLKKTGESITFIKLLNSYSDDRIRRILYFSLPYNEGGIARANGDKSTGHPGLCGALRDFFKKHGLLLSPNPIQKKSKELVKPKFIIERITEQNIDDRKQEIMKELKKARCYGKKYEIITEGYTWYIVKIGTKTIGIFSIDEEFIIGVICFNENIKLTKEKDVIKEGLNSALRKFRNIGDKITLVLYKGKQYEKILAKYLNIGFVVIDTNEMQTDLEFAVF